MSAPSPDGDRLIAAGRVDDDAQYEAGLRPRTLDDYIGQDRIRDNILSAAKSERRGVVWIANRPAQAEPFEQIVVMQGGRIAAQGAPADLAARGGLYAELMASA